MGNRVIGLDESFDRAGLPEEARPRSRWMGCVRKVVVGFVLVLTSVVFLGTGMGKPFRYWESIDWVQVFEGPDRVVLFVEVDRNQGRPGPLVSPANVHLPQRLIRIDIFPDGRVRRALLEHEKRLSFHPNLARIVRGRDDFY